MGIADMAWFWAYAAWTFGIRATWDALPGPWWVRVLLIVARLACPGQLDEIALIAITAAFRRRRAARLSSTESI